MPAPAVLITGCSSGIGRATALTLAKGPWSVYATSRRLGDLEALRAAGCQTMALDVTDEASMRAVVDRVERDHGVVSVLVNNAGYSQSGAVETIPRERVRAQFETNVFGPLRLTQLVLPAMRRERRGRIVNVSSMGGTLVFPGGGVYHATKYAIEAMSDALRFELRGFGIQVVVIQPGLIRTNFGAAATSALETADTHEAYASFNRAVAKATTDAYRTGTTAKLAGSPEDVAATIAQAITASKPKTRYRVSVSAHLFMMQRRLFGDRAWDRFLRRAFPSPGEHD